MSFNGEKVAQGFGHLLLVHPHKAVVDPIVGERLSRDGLRLGHLVFVVGKDEVLSAAVNVEGFAQVFLAHDRAFDMPARAAFSPGARPGGFPRLGGLPEREVHGVFLALVHRHPGAGLHVLQVSARELAVFRKAVHREIDIALPPHRHGPFAISVSMPAMISVMCSVALGSRVAGKMPSASMSSAEGAQCSARQALWCPGPIHWPGLMILSSMSVKLRTYSTSRPLDLKWRTMASKAA